jgi:hypothetical protein
MPKVPWPAEAATDLGGTIFACAKCDADDPMKAAHNWIKGELKTPE